MDITTLIAIVALLTSALTAAWVARSERRWRLRLAAQQAAHAKICADAETTFHAAAADMRTHITRAGVEVAVSCREAIAQVRVEADRVQQFAEATLEALRRANP